MKIKSTVRRETTVQRREFLETTAAVGAIGLTGAAAATSSPDAYQFRLGMYLPKIDLPFDESLATARRMIARYVWFNRLKDESAVASMTDAQAERVAAADLEIFVLNAGTPFKKIHLADLDAKTLSGHPEFQQDLKALVRSMQIAALIGVRTVGSLTFAWPGECSAGKPTWKPTGGFGRFRWLSNSRKSTTWT